MACIYDAMAKLSDVMYLRKCKQVYYNIAAAAILETDTGWS
jgi:hypothetical protein